MAIVDLGTKGCGCLRLRPPTRHCQVAWFLRNQRLRNDGNPYASSVKLLKCASSLAGQRRIRIPVMNIARFDFLGGKHPNEPLGDAESATSWMLHADLFVVCL